MNKETLRYIKNDMWATLHSKKDLNAVLKTKLRELEQNRSESLAEHEKSAGGDYRFRDYCFSNVNKIYDNLRNRLFIEEISRWHNDQAYYLIYKDGSDVYITAEDILNGEKFPKMSDIVYAELNSAYESIDTEKGELDWYTEEVLKACDYNYEVEDERKWQYETAIQFKFHTEWSIRYRKANPNFVPAEI